MKGIATNSNQMTSCGEAWVIPLAWVFLRKFEKKSQIVVSKQNTGFKSRPDRRLAIEPLYFSAIAPAGFGLRIDLECRPLNALSPN